MDELWPRPPARVARRAVGTAILPLGLCLAATVVGPAGPAWPAGGDRWTTGQLLVATEAMPDPRFRETVLYVVRHDAAGAMALAVNRPAGEAPLADVLQQAGLDPAGVAGRIALHAGGPVEPRRGVVLHSAEYRRADTLSVAGGFAVTGDPAILADIAAGRGPRSHLFVLGYAGWAPGQLERETDAGHWITIPADEALVFGSDHASKWRRAIARRRIAI
jgi:putative transcriptional regulator